MASQMKAWGVDMAGALSAEEGNRGAGL
jgi:hypothetical protein